MTPVDDLRRLMRVAITNAYYGARNEGETMEAAADRAADGVLARLTAAESQREALERIAVIENTRIRCVNHGGDVGLPGECACAVALDSGEKAREIARAALKEQPSGHSGARSPAIPDSAEVESGASAVGRIARQGWHRPWCWQQWARSLADSEMGSACTCNAALKEQPR